ncbi:unnamed protein product [Lupinus luteus]|uniref:Vacuolar iron transporter n=1 Tax=Lupinus luteus TaxID=3873 RepID=A0AAV1W1A3_LUPLU
MASTKHVTSIEPEKESLLNKHTKNHFTISHVVRDIIIRASDGLIGPFALAAGLSGANATSNIVLTAGIAEVAAGAISMRLGGYLAAKSEADHYAREMKREQEENIVVPGTEAAEVAEIMAQYGIEEHEYRPVVNPLRKNPEAWLDFRMNKIQSRVMPLEEGNERMNQTEGLPLRLLRLLVVFVVVRVMFSIINRYTIKHFGIESTVTTMSSRLQPCYEPENGLLERWIRPRSNLIHAIHQPERATNLILPSTFGQSVCAMC